MDVTMFLFLVTTLPGFLAGQNMHFTGGSISFKFINTTNTPYKIRITAVTGWVLGMGPCGTSCSRSDLGRTTAASRRQMIDVKGETYFGTWSTEVAVTSKPKKYSTITPYVIKNIKEQVAAVNIPMRWEQDSAYFDLDIDPTCVYTDVSVHGSYWREFNYTYGVNNYPVNYRLQIKVKPAPREDTHEPNNSPVAIFQPVYKIKLNEATTIRLSTFDSDGDFVRCLYAEFVEAGGLTNLNNTVVNKDCSIVINPQESDGFVDGGWGAIPVKVIDTPSKPKIGTTVSYESEVFSAINVQFMIQTLAKMEVPQFVDPTAESQHEFIVYVGSTLKIPLYAKPMEFSVIEIDSFYVRSIPTRTFHLDPVRDDPTRTAERVKYSTVQWRPDKSDVGEYVISALVTDTEGSDGFDRNYHIVVKDMDVFPAMQPLHKGPYFPLFPSINGVVCMINSTCSFPIYTNTDTTGDSVVSLNYTTSTFPQTTISQPSPVTKDGKPMFVSDVHVHPSVSGEQRICFEARDSKGIISNNRCFGVQVQLPDPCKLSPCVNGLCRSEEQSYVCSCGPIYTGRHCESDIDFCASRPCLNNGNCSRTVTHYKCDCAGTGHVGRNCEIGTIDCKFGVCGIHGVCKDLDEKFECDCFSGYSGNQCQTIDKKCQDVSCINGGICVVEGGIGVCKCPLGYSGTECANSDFSSPVNSGTSGTKDNPFMIPSIPNGAEVECHVNRDCVIAVYSKKQTNGTQDIKVGLHSPGVNGTVLSSTLDPRTNALKSLVKIHPTKIGLETLCVNSGSLKTDTLCYKVNATTLTYNLHSQYEIPRFRAPTPTDHSIINCLQGTPCHVVITTDLNLFTKNCTLFSGSTSAIVFRSLTNKSTCETDVLFNPPTTGAHEVCLQAGPQEQLAESIFFGERRCFTLKTAAKDYCDPNPCTPTHGGKCALQPGETPPFQCVCPDTVTGDRCQYQNPCLMSPCLNGGICESDDTSYKCKCPVGYKGQDCEIKIGLSTEPAFTDPSLQNGAIIECNVGKKCVIPIFTKGPSTNLTVGPKDGDMDVKITIPVKKLGQTINEALLEVTPNTPGSKKVCIKTDLTKTQSDDIRCYHIKTKDPGYGSGEMIEEAISGIIVLRTDSFISPSLPNGTKLMCPEKTQCHLIMHSKPDGPNCYQVTENDVGKVDYHIFPTKLEGRSCVTDVVLEPMSTPGLQNFCLQSRDEDVPRCYKVDPDTYEPCANNSCGYGSCIVEPNHSASCVCDDSHTGLFCEEVAPCKSSPCNNNGVCEQIGPTFECHCSIGYQGDLCDNTTDVPSSSVQSFTNVMLPKGSTFICVKDKICKIPISVAKPDAPNPVVEPGPHDKGLMVIVSGQLSKNTDVPGRSDLYKGNVDVTPSETGDKRVCVTIGQASLTRESYRDDSVCYHLHVIDTGSTPTDNFKEPTPAGGSEIRCATFEDCHFLVHSKPKDGEWCVAQGSRLPQVNASNGKANVFPSMKDVTFTDCITDVSVSASELTGSANTICLKARTDSPERCFSIRPRPSTDPCGKIVCDNKTGACILNRDNSASCVCYSNSTSDSCE